MRLTSPKNFPFDIVAKTLSPFLLTTSTFPLLMSSSIVLIDKYWRGKGRMEGSGGEERQMKVEDR